MYKISSCVNIDRQNDKILLVNKLLDGEVEIAIPYMDELELIIKNGTMEIKSELEIFLHEHKYLVDKNIVDDKIHQLTNVMNQTIIISILPTMSCNFRCVYCYEEHEGKKMSEKTLEHIKIFLEQEIVEKGIRYVQINWFGGEPTLCIKEICDFNRYVLSLQKKYTFSFSSGITTNGYLLDVKTFEKLYEVGIDDYQITLDGWKHDEYRKYVTGGKTLFQIMDNLREISKLPISYKYTVRLRYNISEENNELSWYDYIKENFGADGRFAMYINFVKDWGGENVKTIELCTEKLMNNLEKKHIQYMDKIGLKNFNSEKVVKLPLEKVCYASFANSYIFMPDKKVMKCTVALKEEKNKIGWVDDEKGVLIDEEQNSQWCETTTNYCGECEYILSCLHRSCPRQIVIGGQSEECCTLHH